ncbi:trypsin-like serine protease [Actinoplanes sp. NPDC051343]|uniref:trypsin-like serine protease n=1 Tax=Actinoplanes sp. NPDC051343 TaxID=3363906 RepID=UPI0037AA98AC
MTVTIWSARLAAVGASLTLGLAATLTSTTPATASGTGSGGAGANIVGGSDATRPYPFVALEYTYYPELGQSSSCTATVVKVLGSNGPETGAVINANCVTNYPSTEPEAASDITLEVGSTQLDELTPVTPTRVEVYPGWDWATGDMAVLVLPKNLHLTGIPIGEQPTPGRKVRLVGWGDTSIDAPGIPPVLQQLDTRITKPSACADAAIGAGEICVAPAPDGGQACLGDAGAPALSATRTGWALLGSGSRGTNESACTGPTVFTDVTHYRQWIVQALTHPQPHHPRHVAPGSARRTVTYVH